MTRTRRLLTIVLSVFALLLVASAGFAASRPDAAVHRAETESPPAPGDDEGQGDEGQGEDEQGDDQATDEGDDATDEETSVDPEREASCNEAAGIESADDGPTDTSGDATTDGTTDASGDGTTDATTEEPVKLTGLDNAISHVLANCLKNPDAPGLVTALEHLVANQTKHETHDAEKAERKAEHAASKAAHDHGRGKDGRHGNPHADGESGNPHGGGHGHP